MGNAESRKVGASSPRLLPDRSWRGEPAFATLRRGEVGGHRGVFYPSIRPGPITTGFFAFLIRPWLVNIGLYGDPANQKHENIGLLEGRSFPRSVQHPSTIQQHPSKGKRILNHGYPRLSGGSSPRRSLPVT